MMFPIREQCMPLFYNDVSRMLDLHHSMIDTDANMCDVSSSSLDATLHFLPRYTLPQASNNAGRHGVMVSLSVSFSFGCVQPFGGCSTAVGSYTSTRGNCHCFSCFYIKFCLESKFHPNMRKEFVLEFAKLTIEFRGLARKN